MTSGDRAVFWAELLGLAAFVAALVSASVGLVRRRRRGILIGMVCHVVVAGLSLVFVAVFGFAGLTVEGLGPMFLLFAMMCSAFLLTSACAFGYLRSIRQGLAS